MAIKFLMAEEFLQLASSSSAMRVQLLGSLTVQRFQVFSVSAFAMGT